MNDIKRGIELGETIVKMIDRGIDIVEKAGNDHLEKKKRAQDPDGNELAVDNDEDIIDVDVSSSK